MIKKRIAYLFLALLLNACIVLPAPQSAPTAGAPFTIKSADNPYAPKPEDLSMQVGGAMLTSLNLIEQTESTPVRVELNLFGSLPRVCNELRVEVANPNEQYQIFVDVYSLTNPNLKCENVFQQFEAAIALGLYSAGRYTVWVNNEYVGDFVSYQVID